MGLFDDMYIKCPKCDYRIYDQFKPDMYGTMDFDDPNELVEVKEHFVGYHHCPECDTHFEVKRIQEPVYTKVIIENPYAE